ncbi:MAG: molybdopterin-dependent oxidoreductase, partial [Proteobacteria bacterium]|nr:molybdopterin-dependent oxidoreductase [Pseudomonadota bacterium]
MIGWPLRHRTTFAIEKEQTSETTKCALLVGLDPSQGVLRLWKSLRDAKAAGTKIIVVDPRRTKTAEMADLWLQLRPGTDTALLLSMINVVITEELYDREFVNKWCYGFDDVVRRVKDYSPEKMAEITWVDAEKIKQAARWYATLKPGICLHGMGVEQLEAQQDAIQARIILQAIAGNIDVKGGDYIPGSLKELVSEGEMELTEALSPDQRKKQIGADRFRLLSWPGREIIWKYNSKLWKQ